jgi:hypothetical protein
LLALPITKEFGGKDVPPGGMIGVGGSISYITDGAEDEVKKEICNAPCDERYEYP